MVNSLEEFIREGEKVRNCAPELLPGLIAAHPEKLMHVENPTAELVELAMEVRQDYIQYHPNPSDQQKRVALLQSGLNLAHISNPTHEMLLIAFKQSPAAIRYVKNPTDALKGLAIQAHATAIQYIANPTKEMIDLALGSNPSLLLYIDGVSEAQQLAVVAKCGDNIRYAKNPTDAVKFAAIEDDPHSISHMVENESRLTLAEIRRRKSLDPTWTWYGGVQHCRRPPTEAMKLRAVELDGRAIMHLAAPSRSLIVQAIETSPSIVFNTVYEGIITTAVLNRIQAGLAASVEAIKVLTPDSTSRTELFRDAFQSRSEALELPMDLDSRQTF